MILIYRAITFIMGRLPRRLLEFLILWTLRFNFACIPWNRRHLLNIYSRILKHSGTTPSNGVLREVLNQSFRHHARLIISLLCRPEDVEYAREKVDLKFLPQLENLLAQKRGAILTCSSFGLYGHAVIALLSRGCKLRIPVLDSRFFCGLPDHWSSSFVSLGKASRESMEALRRNEIVLIPTIYNFMPKILPIDFFGIPANVTYAPARLSIASGAAILPIFAIDEGDRCRVVSDELIEPQEGPNAVVEMTKRLALIQEKYIGKHPAQWEAYDDIWNLKKTHRRNA